MASILRVNTLTDASSNNSIATSVLHNGSAKAWFNINQEGTQAFRDSYNFSSLSDDAVGVTSVVYTSNMNNANYAAGSMAKDETGGDFAIIRFSTNVLTTGFTFVGEDEENNNIDCNTATASVDGDLA